MVHNIKIVGYIMATNNDHIIVSMQDAKKIKNIVKTYGKIDFVPFIDKVKCKIKFSTNIKNQISMTTNDTTKFFDYYDNTHTFNCTIRKNKFKDSCSITFLLDSIN